MSLKTSISICLFIATLASPIVTKINAVNKKEQPTTNFLNAENIEFIGRNKFTNLVFAVFPGAFLFVHFACRHL